MGAWASGPASLSSFFSLGTSAPHPCSWLLVSLTPALWNPGDRPLSLLSPLPPVPEISGESEPETNAGGRGLAEVLVPTDAARALGNARGRAGPGRGLLTAPWVTRFVCLTPCPPAGAPSTPVRLTLSRARAPLPLPHLACRCAHSTARPWVEVPGGLWRVGEGFEEGGGRGSGEGDAPGGLSRE